MDQLLPDIMRLPRPPVSSVGGPLEVVFDITRLGKRQQVTYVAHELDYGGASRYVLAVKGRQVDICTPVAQWPVAPDPIVDLVCGVLPDEETVEDHCGALPASTWDPDDCCEICHAGGDDPAHQMIEASIGGVSISMCCKASAHFAARLEKEGAAMFTDLLEQTQFLRRLRAARPDLFTD